MSLLAHTDPAFLPVGIDIGLVAGVTIAFVMMRRRQSG